MSLLEPGLKGKGAVVTAAAQGIGAGVATALAAAGVKVMLVDLPRQRELAVALVKTIEESGGEAVFHPCDATDPKAVDAMLAEAAGRWGSLDIAISCVGGGEVARADFLDYDHSEYLRCTELTQHTAFYMAQAAGRRMKAQGSGGKVILVGSIMADFSSPRAAAYTAAKAALRQMAKTAAVELGPLGINVNVIQPGWIDTPGERRMDPEGKGMAEVSTRLPLRRMGTPADIANLACFLASDAAAYITGSVFDCDGGYKVAMSI
eukprot:m.448811 g.448811  ORF g.448811 m.448811 type:complete len:263 (+) comp19713_c0_seq1:369-1157(+)